ncbi:FAD-binding, type 2 [Paramyrothecium foliicola]|nr:FAD-binding, type 2 [Paramyrothecium foliicola]
MSARINQARSFNCFESGTLRFFMMRPLLLLASIWPLAKAAPSQETLAACSELFDALPRHLVWDPLSPNGHSTALNATLYHDTNVNYWNLRSKSNRAACTFYPATAEEVSFAIRTLARHPSVQFALKCSGHNPNIGFSSVDEGVLIAFRPNFQYAIPSADGKTVRVGAGAQWEDVYAALDPLGKSAVGGRLGNVGVSGFTLGGGLSHLSPQYGLACDNVVSFQVVLANGTITTASATSNTDLFFALKGGGNQYAVITEMILKTYDVGQNGRIWGGIRTYTGDKHSELLAAVSRFTANNADPKAALIPTFNFFGVLGLNIPAIIVFIFYDGPAPPAGVFDELDAIPSLTDGTRQRTMGNLVQDVFAGDLEGLGFNIAFNAFPNMPIANMSDFLDEKFETAKAISSKAALEDLINFRLFTFTVQPLPKSISRASSISGNALGLRPEHGDRIWVEYNVAWLVPTCDTACPEFVSNAVDIFHDLHESKYSGIPPTNYESGDLDYIRSSYNPIFMNDAIKGQKVLESYGQETYLRLKDIHERYDPEGLLSTRQGGFTFET